ncbi:DUF2169 domain-containing protein [Massilia sp. W12]|uniref:DUF2169 family type VI secretion system accessory protein n=1 Tax=Massilia sp. W12 TaxID=3126507 RepID=UPI0030CC904E
MEIAIGSKYLVADATVAVDKTGQEHLLIVAKGSWQFGPGFVRPIPAMPIQHSDLYAGKAGLSATLYESDFVLHKPRCDVLFAAQAYAPNGQAVRELLAGYQIGTQQKVLRVHGPRRWQGDPPAPGQAEPFHVMPLHYGYAFGGSRLLANTGQSEIYAANPLGSGFCTDPAAAHDLDMQSLEAHQQPVTRPDQPYAPMALSVLGRNCLPRRLLAGTYDAAWKQDVFPFLPEDFDSRFYQAAPEDQQIDYPQGGEEVVLWHLTSGHPEIRFKLPKLNKAPVRILMRDFSVHQPPVVADTLFFEPDQSRFTVVWRSSLPLKRRIQDVKTVAIAGICKNWWDAKTMGLDACASCDKQRSTQDAAPGEEECNEETA